ALFVYAEARLRHALLEHEVVPVGAIRAPYLSLGEHEAKESDIRRERARDDRRYGVVARLRRLNEALEIGLTHTVFLDARHGVDEGVRVLLQQIAADQQH